MRKLFDLFMRLITFLSVMILLFGVATLDSTGAAETISYVCSIFGTAATYLLIALYWREEWEK